MEQRGSPNVTLEKVIQKYREVSRIMIPTYYYISLSVVLFALGALGVVTRRNTIVVFMCIELMLNAVNLSFVVFSRMHGLDGQIAVFFVAVVAAAEAAVGLAIIISVFRAVKSVETSESSELRL